MPGDGDGQGGLECCSPWGFESRIQWSSSIELKTGIFITEMGNLNTMGIIGSQTAGDKWWHQIAKCNVSTVIIKLKQQLEYSGWSRTKLLAT